MPRAASGGTGNAQGDTAGSWFAVLRLPTRVEAELCVYRRRSWHRRKCDLPHAECPMRWASLGRKPWGQLLSSSFLKIELNGLLLAQLLGSAFFFLSS